VTKSTLKLIKATPVNRAQTLEESESQADPATYVSLTPAECTEAARFKALTTVKAVRQARIRRMMVQLQELDEVSSAA
jgi:hypothetical protein